MSFNSAVVKKLLGRQGEIFGPDGYINPSSAYRDPDRVAAAVSRQEFQHYLDTYKPIEIDTLKEAQRTDFKEEGDRASNTFSRQIALSDAAFNRNLSRTNTTLTAEEQTGLDRRRSISRTADRAGTENVTRRNLSTRNINTLGEMLAVGRGIQNSAAGGLGNAAQMQGQRDAANSQMKSQRRAQQIQTLGMLAAAVIMM